MTPPYPSGGGCYRLRDERMLQRDTPRAPATVRNSHRDRAHPRATQIRIADGDVITGTVPVGP